MLWSFYLLLLVGDSPTQTVLLLDRVAVVQHENEILYHLDVVLFGLR